MLFFKLLPLLLLITFHTQCQPDTTLKFNGIDFKLSLTKYINPNDNGIEHSYFVTMYKDSEVWEVNSQDSVLLQGCSYDAPELKETLLTNSSGHNLGWMVSGLGSICGNSYSNRTYFIVPGGIGGCDIQILDSKSSPIIIPRDENSFELLYYTQEWGKSGTSSSFYIPHSDILKINYNWEDKYFGGIVMKKGSLMKDFEKWSSDNFDSHLIPTFEGLFTAGLQSKDFELMKYAFTNYYNDSNPIIESQGLPTTIEEINEVINSIKKYDEAKNKLNKYDHLYNWE